VDAFQGLSEAQRIWLLYSESLWRIAHEIAAREPHLDPGDVYHALRSLELPPAERLAKGLSRGRLGTHRS
jgi:hypothetical protein